jgi:rhodanese-related sulfurtransferase
MNKKMKLIILGVGLVFASFVIIFASKSITAENDSMEGMPGMSEEEMANMEVYSMTPEELKKELNNNEIVIVDIREPHLYKKGHIPNAINIPFGQFQQRFHELDANKQIVIVYHIGEMGMEAGQYLLENGYMHVANLVGGIAQWDGPLTSKMDP